MQSVSKIEKRNRLVKIFVCLQIVVDMASKFVVYVDIFKRENFPSDREKCVHLL